MLFIKALHVYHSRYWYAKFYHLISSSFRSIVSQYMNDNNILFQSKVFGLLVF